MAYSTNIADILNEWAAMGVFDYVIPFLLIFAIVFGILEKSGLFGKAGSDGKGQGNKGVEGIIAIAVALLSLQFDYVSTFFANIFPKLGVVLAVLLVFVILISLSGEDSKAKSTYFYVGIILAAAAILWSVASWDFFGADFAIGYWFQENFWPIIMGILVVVTIVVIIGKGGGPDKP